jgi:hypothetical protein
MAYQTNSKNMFYLIGEETDTQEISKNAQDNVKDAKYIKNKTTKFVVATSYNQTRNTNRPQTGYQPNARTGAFNSLVNKQQMATKLQFTQPCKHLKQDAQGVWTACFREVCTFAHSLDEYKCPPCQFDKNCRFRYGRYNNQGVLDKQAACRFKHGNETVEQWCNRIQKPLPHLPQTNEQTRKPQTQKTLLTKNEQDSLVFTLTDSEDEDFPPPPPTPTLPPPPPPTPTLPIPTLPIPTLPIPTPPTTLPTPKKVVSDSDSDSESESESESDYKDRKRRERRQKQSKHQKEPERIVIVPTEALAKMALKTLFKQGVFNVKVVIES